MDFSVDLPIAEGGKLLDGLQAAVQFLNERASQVARGVSHLGTALDKSFSLVGIDEDAAGGALVEKLAEERRQLAQKSAQQSQLLVNLLGEGSKPDLIRNYIKARDNVLEVVKAQQTGVLDMDASTEALVELERSLAKARQAAIAAGHGGDVAGMESNSAVKPGKLAGMAAKAAEAKEIFLKAGKAGLDQLTGVGQGMLGLMRGTPLAGGIWGLMLFGYKEADRLAAEAGEIVNIASAAGESGGSASVGRMAAFQEKAQRYYGISRREVQSNLTTYVEAGLKFDEVFKQQGTGLGEVGSSAVHMSLALDRHFEMAGGTTARMAAKAVASYGMDLSGALSTIAKVAFAANKVGLGASAFVSWVFQATGQVRNLGIGLDDAAASAAALATAYREKGVNANAAGKLAQEGLGEAYQGLSRQSTGNQIYLAEQMGMGKGLDARQEMLSGVQGRPEVQAQLMKILSRDALEAGGGGQNEARFFLEQKGYGFEGARAIMELAPKFSGKVRLEELTVADREKLKDAFKTESQKTSDLQKGMKQILEGMAMSGRAMLAILTNFAAISIVGMKAIPILLGGTQEDKERVYTQLGRYKDGTMEAWNAMLAGSNKMLEGAGRNLLPLLRPVTRALNFDPGAYANPEMDRAASPTEANARGVLNDTFSKLTGRGMSPADEAVLTGVTGYSKEEIDRLSGTQEGQERLRAAIAAARTRSTGAPPPNPVKAAGFTPGASGRGSGTPTQSPSNLAAEMGLDVAGGIGVGTLGKGPNKAAPLPTPKDAPKGPLGARLPVKDVRWDVPGGYKGPLVAEVEVTWG